MRFFDLLFLIFDNLGRRKARVALTAVGVVIGTAAVVVLVSLAIGLQRNANEQLYGIGDLTQIQVMPNYGEYGGPGPMYGGGGGGGSSTPPTQQMITNESLREMEAIPGVQTVIPRDWLNTGGMITFGRLEGYASITGMGIPELSPLGVTAASGTLELKKGTAIVGAMVSQGFYNPRWRPGMEPPTPPDLMDANLKLTLIKYTQDGQEVRKVVPIRIAGVLAEERGEPPLLLLLDTLQDPQNLGTLMRTAEIVGVHGILLPLRHTVTVTPAVVHASSGASEHLLVAQVNLAQAIESLKQDGIWVVGLEGGEVGGSPTEMRLDGPLALVVGSEGQGMRPLVRASCDLIMSLPQRGRIDSLNAAVAGSIALYLIWQTRGYAGV